MLTRLQLSQDMRALLRWKNNPPSITCYGKPFKRSRYIRFEGREVRLITVAVCTTGRPGDTENAPEEVHVFTSREQWGDEGALHAAADFVRKNP
jgi:hypothetical protein